MTWRTINLRTALPVALRFINSQMLVRDDESNRRKPKESFFFYEDNVRANLTALQLKPWALSKILEIIPARHAYVIGMVVQANGAVSTGSITLTPTVDGTVLGKSVILNSSASVARTFYERDQSGPNFVNADNLDAVGVQLTTSSDLAPLSLDIQVTLMLEYTCEDAIV